MIKDKALIVLHVAAISDNFICGPSYSVPGLVESLCACGVQCALLSSSHVGLYTKPVPFTIFHGYRLGFRSLDSLDAPFRRPDLICLHSTYILPHALISFQASTRGIPYLITPRGGMTDGAQARKRWKKRFANFLFFSRMVRKATAIHCLTEGEAKSARKWGRPVFVVGNGVTLPPEESLAHPGRNAGVKFLFLGRKDINNKGLDILVKGCAIAKSTLLQERAEVLIYGPEVSGDEAMLHRMVDEYELHSVLRIGGELRGKDKARILGSADVFLHPSRHEGHPMSVLEALSYGLPCLITPGTNMAKEVALCSAGWNVAPDPSAIATKLLEVVANRKLLGAKGLAARRMAQDRYSWSRVGLMAKEQYLNLLSHNPRRF